MGEPELMPINSAGSARQGRLFWGVGSAAWGLLGVSALLGQAAVRLTRVAAEPLAAGMPAVVFGAYLLSIGFFGYSEGYRAFQRVFAPRVVARAYYLQSNPSLLRMLLAPLFCMGFFGTTRRRKIITWSLSLGIVGIVIAVRALPQPWRGAIDAGVALALLWGVLAILVGGFRAVVLGVSPNADPELSPRDASRLVSRVPEPYGRISHANLREDRTEA
jgi:hypothetical protein